MATNFRWVTTVDKEDRRYVYFFVQGWEYSLIDIALGLPGRALFNVKLLTFSTHLYGVDKGGIHLFGTDVAGKDIFSRTLHAIYTSLAVGTIGVVIAFVLALVIACRVRDHFPADRVDRRAELHHRYHAGAARSANQKRDHGVIR